MAASNKATALKDSYINAIAAEVGPEGMGAAGAFQNDNLAGKMGMKAGGDMAGGFRQRLAAGLRAGAAVANRQQANRRQRAQEAYNNRPRSYSYEPHIYGGGGTLREDMFGNIRMR